MPKYVMRDRIEPLVEAVVDVEVSHKFGYAYLTVNGIRVAFLDREGRLGAYKNSIRPHDVKQLKDLGLVISKGAIEVKEGG